MTDGSCSRIVALSPAMGLKGLKVFEGRRTRATQQRPSTVARVTIQQHLEEEGIGWIWTVLLACQVFSAMLYLCGKPFRTPRALPVTVSMDFDVMLSKLVLVGKKGLRR